MKVGRIVDDVGGKLISVALRRQVWTLLHHNIVKLVCLLEQIHVTKDHTIGFIHYFHFYVHTYILTLVYRS